MSGVVASVWQKPVHTRAEAAAAATATIVQALLLLRAAADDAVGDLEHSVASGFEAFAYLRLTLSGVPYVLLRATAAQSVRLALGELLPSTGSLLHTAADIEMGRQQQAIGGVDMRS